MKSFIPFEVNYSPVEKLALIPFEKKPDSIYCGLEFQYINSIKSGTGYRILAYRNDKRVDVYDEKSLVFDENETFDVVENGLNKHVQAKIDNAEFSRSENRQTLSFSFTDIENRKIIVSIAEKSERKTCPMNLLAPIGVGSTKPNCLPVFFMYDFDMVRRGKTAVICTIDGKETEIDKFSFPMAWQMRLFARYSNECELFEFADSAYNILKEVELDENNTYTNGNVEYIFEAANVLRLIRVHFNDNAVEICFSPSLDITKSCEGSYSIVPREQMGYLRGNFSVRAGERTTLSLDVADGWISKPNSPITKFLLSKNFVFCSWSRKYSFESVIDIKTRTIASAWKNGNIENK